MKTYINFFFIGFLLITSCELNDRGQGEPEKIGLKYQHEIDTLINLSDNEKQSQEKKNLFVARIEKLSKRGFNIDVYRENKQVVYVTLDIDAVFNICEPAKIDTMVINYWCKKYKNKAKEMTVVDVFFFKEYRDKSFFAIVSDARANNSLASIHYNYKSNECIVSSDLGLPERFSNLQQTEIQYLSTNDADFFMYLSELTRTPVNPTPKWFTYIESKIQMVNQNGTSEIHLDDLILQLYKNRNLDLKDSITNSGALQDTIISKVTQASKLFYNSKNNTIELRLKINDDIVVYHLVDNQFLKLRRL